MRLPNCSQPIVQLIDLYKTGGAEKVYDLFSSWCNQNNILTKRVVLIKSEVADIDYLLEENRTSLIAKALDQLKAIRRLKKIVRRQKCRTLVSFCDRSNIVSILALGKSRKYKVVATVHNPPTIQYQKLNSVVQKAVFAVLRHFYNRKNVQVIAVSEMVKNSLEKIGIKNVRTVLNPLVVDYSKQEETVNDIPSRPYFLFIGRLEEQKAIWKLIKAFFLYLRKIQDMPDAVNSDVAPKALLIVGTGSQQAKIEKLIFELGLEKNVHLLGYKANVFPYLKNCASLVFSSIFEGFPITLLECMALKKPFLGSDRAIPDELKELLKDNAGDFYYTTTDFSTDEGSAFSATKFCDDSRVLSAILEGFADFSKAQMFRMQAEKNFDWFCRNCSVQNFKRYFE